MDGIRGGWTRFFPRVYLGLNTLGGNLGVSRCYALADGLAGSEMMSADASCVLHDATLPLQASCSVISLRIQSLTFSPLDVSGSIS
jgi:hypothetical protein